MADIDPSLSCLENQEQRPEIARKSQTVRSIPDCETNVIRKANTISIEGQKNETAVFKKSRTLGSEEERTKSAAFGSEEEMKEDRVRTLEDIAESVSEISVVEQKEKMPQIKRKSIIDSEGNVIRKGNIQSKEIETGNVIKKASTLSTESRKSEAGIKKSKTVGAEEEKKSRNSVTEEDRKEEKGFLNRGTTTLEDITESPEKISSFSGIGEIKRVFNSLQYSFSQFGRVIHYINIANSLPKNLNGLVSDSKSLPFSSEDPYLDEDEMEEEEKLIKELLITENKRKKVLKVNVPLTFLAFTELNKSLAEEKNLILHAKKRRNLEVYLKWKLKKWDNSEKPKRKTIYCIPCRICLNKIWSNKLASHSKLCLQKSQIGNDLENHRKTLLKFIDMAIENKRNLEIQRRIEKSFNFNLKKNPPQTTPFF